MTRRVALREIAHARAGDKGDRSNVAVFVHDLRHYPAVKAQLTPERLRAEFGELLLWEVESLLCCGPAGGGGYRGRITPSVITHSAYVDRAQVHPRLEIVET